MRLPTFSRVTSRMMRAPRGVEREVDRRLLGLAVEAGLRVGEVLAGQQHLALDDQRRWPPRST